MLPCPNQHSSQDFKAVFPSTRLFQTCANLVLWTSLTKGDFFLSPLESPSLKHCTMDKDLQRRRSMEEWAVTPRTGRLRARWVPGEVLSEGRWWPSSEMNQGPADRATLTSFLDIFIHREKVFSKKSPEDKHKTYKWMHPHMSPVWQASPPRPHAASHLSLRHPPPTPGSGTSSHLSRHQTLDS